MSTLDYHDVHVTTPTIERTSIFNLPFRVILQCTRVGGWALWGRAEEIFGEVYYEENLGERGLRVDVAGHVIYDTLTPQA